MIMPSNKSNNENDVSMKRKSSRLLRIITSPNGFMSALKPNSSKQDVGNRRFKDSDAPVRDNAIDMSLSVAEPERAHELPAYSPMFHAAVSTTVAIKLPRGYRMRSLQQTDYDTYTQLKTIGAMTRKAWDEQCYYLQSRNDTYTILVITDPTGTVVCTGTLLLERKLVNGGTLVGQIKDLCVAPSQKGKNLGLRMLEQLNQLAIDAGCSKTSVMTQDVNEAFYRQRGFRRTTELEMTRFHGDASTLTPNPTSLQARRTLVYSCDPDQRISAKLGLETITREIIRTSNPV